MYELGYTTGTFDFTHSGHFKLLQNIKLYCRKLIVGLVTDELARKQKRNPIMSYSQRYDILINCKWVDRVVEFTGTPKIVDYEKLKFDVLFIDDSYYLTQEYVSFSEEIKNRNLNVPVIYIPRTSGISTSDIYLNLLKRFISESQIRARALTGDILEYHLSTSKKLLTKTINIGRNEWGNSSNAYALPFPPPRNWKMLKRKDDIDFPLISGINSNREIIISNVLRKKTWYPLIDIIEKDYEISKSKDLPESLEERIMLMNTERRFPAKIYWLIMRDGGQTLEDWVKNKSKIEREMIYSEILNIISEMKDLGVLHMDLHANNILIDGNNRISIIDFGWCMHSSFDMDEDELRYYKNCLLTNFDKLHFLESLVYMGIEENVPIL